MKQFNHYLFVLLSFCNALSGLDLRPGDLDRGVSEVENFKRMISDKLEESRSPQNPHDVINLQERGCIDRVQASIEKAEVLLDDLQLQLRLCLIRRPFIIKDVLAQTRALENQVLEIDELVSRLPFPTNLNERINFSKISLKSLEESANYLGRYKNDSPRGNIYLREVVLIGLDVLAMQDNHGMLDLATEEDPGELYRIHRHFSEMRENFRLSRPSFSLRWTFEGRVQEVERLLVGMFQQLPMTTKRERW